MRLVAKITVSSAYSNKYKRKYTATSSVSRRRAAVLISTRPLYACDINSTKSLKKMANNTGDRFSPWRTPTFD